MDVNKSKEQENQVKPASVIPVIEENIHIDKRVIDATKVQISKKVNTEEVTVNVPTVHEEVSVERVTVNQYVDTPPEIKQEGDTTIIPIMKEVSIMKEVLVVEKRLMLVEEVHVTRRRVETQVSQNELLRKEEIFIERKESK
jgi:uncharacterized protein (TIGR02271 family)